MTIILVASWFTSLLLPALPAAALAAAPADDITLALSVADALVGAKLNAAQAVPGVRQIENRLISAEIFEHD